MPKTPTRKRRRWRAYLMHGKRAQYLGEVEAETEAEAYCTACHEFGIEADWQRRRVFVRRKPE
jgi:hypothetical protein